MDTTTAQPPFPSAHHRATSPPSSRPKTPCSSPPSPPTQPGRSGLCSDTACLPSPHLPAVRPGTTPDNVSWVHRKQNTVLRFGVSTWYMHNKFSGDEGAFARKYGLGERAGEYAIHGGGVPIRVRGVEGVVAVVVVSGLKQEEDHMIVVQTVGDFLESLGEAVGVEGEKKKED
ncbi:hypothetical protein H2203_000526 [Taxawa tesnikishii (nom. ined.)]|nr:hypothetical protein H2203_000526 [Dothideales sp. JES 119]